MRDQLARLYGALKVAAEAAVRELRVPADSDAEATGAARLSFHVQVDRDELDGGYIAECVELPGCVSQGETEHEAIENLIEAITGVVEVRMQRHLDQVVPGEYKLAPPGQSHRIELPVT